MPTTQFTSACPYMCSTNPNDWVCQCQKPQRRIHLTSSTLKFPSTKVDIPYHPIGCSKLEVRYLKVIPFWNRTTVAHQRTVYGCWLDPASTPISLWNLWSAFSELCSSASGKQDMALPSKQGQGCSDGLKSVNRSIGKGTCLWLFSLGSERYNSHIYIFNTSFCNRNIFPKAALVTQSGSNPISKFIFFVKGQP